MDEVKPAARLPKVEHREPCESRGSRTVLGAPGGEIPPGNSSITSDIALGPNSAFGVLQTLDEASTKQIGSE